jgi:hypothetical protein
VVRVKQDYRAVTLAIELVGQGNNVLWASGPAQLTPFAPLDINDYAATGHIL